MPKISSKTGLCCLIGDPVEHSVSPAMHNVAYNVAGLNYVYLTFQIKKQALKTAVEGLKAVSVRGINVTTPHKVSIIQLLDALDETAESIGAVNTIVNLNGCLKGYNTDGVGVLKALKPDRVNGKRVLVLGAGGAARAIVYSIAGLCSELTVLNRTPSRAKQLAEEVTAKRRKEVKWGSLRDAERFMENYEILINATSIGMHPNIEDSPIKAGWLRKGTTVFDAVYNPVETRLLKDAKAAGLKGIGGLEMLVQQGAESIRMWFNIKPEIDLMRKAALEALKTGAY